MLGRAWSRVKQVVRPPALRVGAPAPVLSLTAEEGTWIKSADFKGHLGLWVAFLEDPSAPATKAWLQALAARAASLQGQEVAVFGVSTWRPERLRAWKAEIGVPFLFLYDPLALTARSWQASHRVRPLCRDALVRVGVSGGVEEVFAGLPPVDQLLPAAAGVPVSAPEPAREAVQDITSAEALALLGAPGGGYRLIDVRTASEFERDRSPLAIHLPVDELPARIGELGELRQLVFVCQGGGRSAAAADFVARSGGRAIYNVRGGMSAWTGARAAGAVDSPPSKG